MVNNSRQPYSGTQKKIESLLRFGIVIMLLLIANVLARDYFFRIDLTEDKRYTITDATKNLLRELDDVVYVEVYLEGEVPGGFKRLQRSIRETLEEFRNIAGPKVQFSFIDPAEAASPEARNEFYQRLAAKGLQPTNIIDTEGGRKTEKIVVPGAVISYGGEEQGVMLLGGNKAASPEEKLNQSVEGIEYALASTIQALAREQQFRVGWLTGHGELDSVRVSSVQEAIAEKYILEEVFLPAAQNLDRYDALIMAKPTQPFSEQAKYKLDQYLLNGGRGLFFVDQVLVNMDSAGGEGTLGIPLNLNLNDFFFNYGIRLNQNLVQDLSSGAYPVVVGNIGTEPQIQMMPWPFFPVLNNYGPHVIVRNLDATYGQFMSTIDTVKSEGISKVPLILTSEYARTFNAPVRVSINDLRRDLNPKQYTEGPLPVGFLLEGRFPSLYQNRFLPEGVPNEGFLEEGEARLITVADGDFIANELNFRTGEPYPLGFAPFTQQTFANQEFVMNSLAYLTNEEGLILARNKEVSIRPLDPVQSEEEKLFWQVVNLAGPVVLVILLGLVFNYVRKRRYTHFKSYL
ncbi:gliding motility-associated ABC transporter substrate-binding protein GldG [Nafulsella turpanensis]|uniref:gliding motility-associated ABC transporter substrate-binding protein GldG n=1 Tax=Nafulsella turpanensis TaxID=1265690 RepID=UPI000346F578|nr:gliding motility-associated ABC transporter substrate-binding protein GldG [Nafulsella turpanensis]